MHKINTKELLLKIFLPTTTLTLAYLLLGHFCQIPHLLLFCILGTLILVPMELGMILLASKKEFGTYSLKSAFVGQEKMAIWKVVLFAFCFFGIAGLLSSTVASLELQLLAPLRNYVLSLLPAGFDWTNYEYLKTFSRPVLVLICVYYCIFNIFVGPITEELFFRGYLTSHYEKQNAFTPILIAILFSLYHFWIPFNNIFRILAFAPVAYVAYRKKNIYIFIVFHCLCNFISSISFTLAVLG
jgi:membrane protease YdiL (CAAX protease family)